MKSEGSLIELKLLTESLEKENETLKSSNGNRDILSKENLKLKTQLEKAVLESRELEGLKAENLKLKKRKSEQIEKNIIFKSKIGQNLYQLQIPSEIGGTHQFVKDGDFSKPEILNCQAIASEIDEICPERKGPLLLKVFNTNIKKYLDDRLDNREYKKIDQNTLLYLDKTSFFTYTYLVKKLNKRDLIKKLVVEPKTQKRMFWAREMKLLNDLMSIFSNEEFWQKVRTRKVPSLAVLKAERGILYLRKKYREFNYEIPLKEIVNLGEKSGKDKVIQRKIKTIRQFIDE